MKTCHAKQQAMDKLTCALICHLSPDKITSHQHVVQYTTHQ